MEARVLCYKRMGRTRGSTHLSVILTRLLGVVVGSNTKCYKSMGRTHRNLQIQLARDGARELILHMFKLTLK